MRRGYINAIVEVRGTGSSGGEFGLFSARDAQDGAELVRWAAALPRSSGRVGGAGYSYPGLNQIHTAAAVGRGSPLKAIVPSAAGLRPLPRPRLRRRHPQRAVRLGLGRAPLEHGHRRRPTTPAADPVRQLIERVDRARGLAALDAELYTEIELGGERAFDSPFWQERAPSRAPAARGPQPRARRCMISGWFDVYQRGVVLNYAALQNAWAGRRRVFGPMRRGQRLTPRYQLVQGPWLHNAVGMGEWIQEIHLEWFDRWLRGKRTALTRTRRPLHAFELGSGRWIDAGVYPLPRTRVRTLWLDGGPSGTAPLSLNDGVLAARPPGTGLRPAAVGRRREPLQPPDRPVEHGLPRCRVGRGRDAAQPVCGGRSEHAGRRAHLHHPAVRAGRRPWPGPVSVGVQLSSTTRDSQLVASLEDVAPDGSSYPLTSGALLGSLRAARPPRELAPPAAS